MADVNSLKNAKPYSYKTHIINYKTQTFKIRIIMKLKPLTSIAFVFILLFSTACLATEQTKEQTEESENKPEEFWIHVEVNVYKNGIQVSKPALTTMSNHPINVATEAKDQQGSTSFILIDMTPVVKNGDDIEVKGEISVALEAGEKEKKVAQINKTIKSEGVIKTPINLKEDKYLFELKFKIKD